MKSTIDQLKAARLVSTPIICVRTADPASIIESVKAAKIYHPSGKKAGNAPLLIWDIVNGLRAQERACDEAEPSAAALKKCLNDAEQSSSTNPVEALVMLRRLPPGGICFFLNAHRFMDDVGPIQAIWNLRDDFKASMKMLILVCPSMTLPAELQQDVLVLDEPLPTDAELKAIALRLYKETELPEPAPDVTERIIDATLGLAAFPAEQTMAMSLTPKGMELEELWNRKRSAIDSSPGLSVWRGGEKFSDIGGCENIKTFLRAVAAGKNAPRCCIYLDEIEKAIGTGNDTSGVSQGMLGQILSWMQDNNATGILLVGPPGCSKSLLSKAFGNEAGIPTIAMDLGGMKDSLVGASEARLRNALKVVDAVSQKRAIFVASCNSIAVLPPELRRRFSFGVFFADLPDATERATIWGLYRKKFELPDEYETPDDEGWTGAEIRTAAELSWRLERPLTEVANYIVPVSRSAADQIDKLRQQADSRYISTSYPGVYRYDKAKQAAIQVVTGRRVQFAEPN